MTELLAALASALAFALNLSGAAHREGVGPAYKRLTRIGLLQVLLTGSIPLIFGASYLVKRVEERRVEREREFTRWVANGEIKAALAVLMTPFSEVYLARIARKTPEGALVLPLMKDLQAPEALAVFETLDLEEQVGPLFQNSERTWRNAFAVRWRTGLQQLDAAVQRHGDVISPYQRFALASLRQRALFSSLQRLEEEPLYYFVKTDGGNDMRVLPLDYSAYMYHDRMRRGESSNYLMVMPDGGVMPTKMESSSAADLLKSVEQMMSELESSPPNEVELRR